MSFKICLLPGDGIGPEVIASARTLLEALPLEWKFVECGIGFGEYERSGSPLPDSTIEEIRARSGPVYVVTQPGDALPMPLQGLLYGEAAARFTRVHAKEFAGSPVGQIVGSIDKVRPARDIVLDMVDGWIEATQRLYGLMDPGE